jgi:hypothetical protein
VIADIEPCCIRYALTGADHWSGCTHRLPDDDEPGAWGPTAEQEEGWDAREEFLRQRENVAHHWPSD